MEHFHYSRPAARFKNSAPTFPTRPHLFPFQQSADRCSVLLAFLYIARGSAGEVRSMLCFIEQRPAFNNLKFKISNLKSAAESCSRQLRAWADYLQNSDIKGQRHLNEKSRQHFDSKRKAEDFQQELMERLPPNHPLRRRS